MSSISENFQILSNVRLYDSKMIAQYYFPKISVIIPCFQKGNYLPRAFKSCIDDQYLSKFGFNIEIICIDDASTDDTYKIFQELKRKYETNDIFNTTDNNNVFKNNVNIKIFHFNENKGTLYARLFALNQSSADYIMALDADDELIPGIMQRLLTLIQYRPDIEILQFRWLCLNEKTENKTIESKKMNSEVKFHYSLFLYGSYHFNLSSSVTLDDSIEVHKYEIGEKLVNENQTDLDSISHSHKMNSSELRSSILKNQMMWNIPSVIMKKELMLKSVLSLDFNPETKKVSEYEDKLIMYACFYFCDKFYMVDEIGYIYHSGIYTPRRKPRLSFVNFLLYKLYVSGRKNVSIY